MIQIRRKTKLYKLLHDCFRALYPVFARILKLKKWEGDFWHFVTNQFFTGKKTLLMTCEGHKMIVRLNHLTDLTAVFGRPEESEIKNIIRKLPREGVFIDAGAHIGRYTLMAAKYIGPSGRVLAFEPDPQNFELLGHNCMLNGYEWIESEQCALGKTEGTVRLISGNDAATNTIMSDWHKQMQSETPEAKETLVPLKKLDSVLKNANIHHVDLLKIDVEGAEILLLQGSESFLNQKRIKKIVCEVHSPIVKKEEIFSLLKKYGYSIKDIGNSEIFAELGL